jgi:predicted N-acyltransferase
MVLHLDESWSNFDDYIEALSSKYRVRVRRAFKKAKRIVKREFTTQDLQIHHDKIIEYYRDIAENASFNLFILNPDYFISVKRHLGDRFRIFGYFEGEKLIAFYSLMINGDEIEAHFLGYEEDTNRHYQLYLNMLLDMIDMGIALGMKRIIYGRTATEIKSSVGARPEMMYFYLQVQNAILNPFVPWIYNTLEPEAPWTQRHPFKDAGDDSSA